MDRTPAGWYPDPTSADSLRWWDGMQWSTSTLPLDRRPPGATESPTADRPGVWNTVWIWLVVILPVLPGPLLLLIPWGDAFDQLPTPTPGRPVVAIPTAFLSPTYFLVAALGWIAFGIGLWSAYRDHRTLLERGVVRPFHWAFFVIGWVYPIGRSVVVHRRTGHGWAPFWATIVTIVGSFAVQAVIVVEVVGGILRFTERVAHVLPT